jgi:hypothetical protein
MQHRPVPFSARRRCVSCQVDSDAARRRVVQRNQAPAPDHGAHNRALVATLSATDSRGLDTYHPGQRHNVLAPARPARILSVPRNGQMSCVDNGLGILQNLIPCKTCGGVLASDGEGVTSARGCKRFERRQNSCRSCIPRIWYHKRPSRSCSARNTLYLWSLVTVAILRIESRIVS